MFRCVRYDVRSSGMLHVWSGVQVCYMLCQGLRYVTCEVRSSGVLHVKSGVQVYYL